MADNDREVTVSLIANVSKFQKAIGKATKSFAGFSKGSATGASVAGAAVSGVAGAIVAAGAIVVGVVTKVAKTVRSLVTGIFQFLASVLKSAVSLVASAANGVASLIKSVFTKMVSFTKIVAVGVTGAAIAWGVMMQKVANTGDELAKLSKRTLTSVGWLSKMKYVLGLADISIMDFGNSIRGLNRAIEGTVRGGAEYVDMWKMVGVSMYDTRGEIKGTETLFMEVIDALRNVEPGLRGGLAQKLLGRGGMQMMTLMEMSVEDVAAAMARAKRMGVMWTPEQAAAAEEYNDAVLSLKTSFGGLVKTFSAPFLKPMAESFDRLANRVSEFQPQAEQLSSKIKELRTTAIDAINAVMDQVSESEWSDKGWKDNLKSVSKSAINIGKATIDILKIWALIAVDVIIAQIYNGVGEIVVKIAAKAQTYAEERIKAITARMKETWDPFETAALIASQITMGGVRAASQAVGGAGAHGAGWVQPDRSVELAGAETRLAETVAKTGAESFIKSVVAKIAAKAASRSEDPEALGNTASIRRMLAAGMAMIGTPVGMDIAKRQQGAERGATLREQLRSGVTGEDRMAIVAELRALRVEMKEQRIDIGAWERAIASTPLTINVTGGIITDDILMRKFQTFWTRLRKGG